MRGSLHRSVEDSGLDALIGSAATAWPVAGEGQ
jgi:hypothetical protein